MLAGHLRPQEHRPARRRGEVRRAVEGKAATPTAAKGMTPQRAIAWVRAVLILTVALAGCAPMTPEVRAAIEEQERRRAIECERRGGWYVTGSSCISRGGGA